jgi:hypothetical protein
MFTFIAGVVVGAAGILIWNAVNPNKVAKFTKKYKDKVKEELQKLEGR